MIEILHLREMIEIMYVREMIKFEIINKKQVKLYSSSIIPTLLLQSIYNSSNTSILIHSILIIIN